MYTDEQKAQIRARRVERQKRIDELEAKKLKFKTALDKQNAIRMAAVKEARTLQAAIDGIDAEIAALRQVKDG